jgi:riboflavin kinase/FMN adenylyltransferase
MKCVRGSWSNVSLPEGERCITLGTFDGVHLGHQALIEETCAVGHRPGMNGAVVVTFGRHPRSVLSPEAAPARLTSDGEREQLIAALGVDVLVVLDFGPDLAQLDYQDFVRQILRARLGMGHFVLGHDVHFGRGRGGHLNSVADLAEREGFGLSQVASVRYAGEPISSTRLRAALVEGELEAVESMLGHPYLVRGTVIRGRQVGRGLGFPTANLQLEHPRKLLPPRGVYGGWARRPKRPWRPALANLGLAPTVADPSSTEPRLEAHLLGEEGDFYGETVELLLARPLRQERRFESLEDLRAAIDEDRRAWTEQAARLSPDVHFSRLGESAVDRPSAGA